MAGTDERKSVQDAYGLLTGLASADVARVIALGQTVKVTKGQKFFSLGGQADRLYLVRKGRARLTMPLTVRGEIQQILIEEKGHGEALGWSALVPPHHFTLNAEAIVDSELIEVSGPVLLDFLSTNREVGFTIVTNMAQMIGRRLLTVQTMWARAMQRTVESLDRNV